MPPKRFGVRLRELRRKRRLTQAALAVKAGVTREYLARLEAGQHDPPLSRVERLAKALGAPVTELLR